MKPGPYKCETVFMSDHDVRSLVALEGIRQDGRITFKGTVEK
jgi:hypothetical protein